MPQNQPITVELEEDQALLERHLETGGYEPPSAVLRAGLHALDREQADFEQTTRERLKNTGRDRSKARPANEVLERLRQRHFELWGKMPDEV